MPKLKQIFDEGDVAFIGGQAAIFGVSMMLKTLVYDSRSANSDGLRMISIEEQQDRGEAHTLKQRSAVA
jgi:hypothetical protein